MRKVLSIILIFILASICLASCADSQSKNEYDETINQSIVLLKKCWEDVYQKRGTENHADEIFITNTRVVKIKESCGIERFQDIDYIVEFVVYSDYLGNGGKYYDNYDRFETAVVFCDGTIEIEEINPLDSYCNSRYDFSYPMVEDVIELGAQYNKTIHLNLSK